MIDATLPLGGAVLLPVLAAAVAACLPRRARPWLGVLASLATLVVVVLAVVSNLTGSVQTELGGWTPPLGIGLRLTGPGALLILMTALVGAAISLYPPRCPRAPAARRSGRCGWGAGPASTPSTSATTCSTSTSPSRSSRSRPSPSSRSAARRPGRRRFATS